MNQPFHHRPATQQGIVLVVAMIMLVIMSILGISSIRTVALEERMSASSHDRSIALQAAEAALLAGESDVMAINPDDAAPIDGFPAIVNGYAAVPTNLPPDWMLNAQWQQISRELPVDFGNLAGTRPRYLIEYRGQAVCKFQNANETAADHCATETGKNSPECNCALFRITARSNPGQGRAEVILQSLFTKS